MLIVCAETGTILNAEHCYVLEDEKLPDEILSDSEISAVATEHGKSLMQIGQNTGWGDNRYSWTVSYSPLSLRDEARSYLEGGIFTEEDTEYETFDWVANKATYEELTEISWNIMADDSLWDGFKNRFVDAVLHGYNELYNV